MTVPTYDAFIEPLLRVLHATPEGVSARSAQDQAADALGLTAEDREFRVPSGQPMYRNRCGWAHDRLKRAGYSSSPKRGHWRLTDTGIQYAAALSGPMTPAEVEKLATGFNSVRLRQADESSHPVVAALATPPSDALRSSPEERLTSALDEIRTSVADEVLELLHRVSPGFFEAIVLDVLHRMGYGARQSDLQRTGGSNDAGIDGVISLDRLGLEKVYVQAKRWQQVVGRPEIQGFYGALAGVRANKGVFITTSSFSRQAIDFATSIERIVLVDGERLAQLMVEHEVGVSTRALKVPRVDSDYFEE